MGAESLQAATRDVAELQQVSAKESKYVKGLIRRVRQLKVGGDVMDLFGDPIPSELMGEYRVDDFDSNLRRGIQKKYLKRPSNIKRCWNRVQLYLPELMHHDAPGQKVLEMSTAHGGMLEVLRHFGHDVLGNDYLNFVSNTSEKSRAFFRNLNDKDFQRETDDYGLPVPGPEDELVDWPYRRIIDSINIPMALFDAGHVPYPFEDKKFDVLICMQAIEHYCHPKDWMTIIDEFCRITRRSIVLLLNPVRDNLGGAPDDYEEAYSEAKYNLRNYRRNGFACTSCHMHWGEPVGFKLSAI